MIASYYETKALIWAGVPLYLLCAVKVGLISLMSPYLSNSKEQESRDWYFIQKLILLKNQEPKTTKTWKFIYLRQSDAPSPEFKQNSLIIIYLCMLLHFLCSQNNKYSCETQ